MNLIMLGAPGAGKGTQAQKLAAYLKVPQISTGDMLRQAVAEGTSLGIEARKYMDAGKLVPDEVVVGIVNERIRKEDCRNGFILDGFPRTLEQAKALDKIARIDHVINIDVPEEILVERITGRRSCKKCGAVYHVKYNPPKHKDRCDVCGEALYQRDDDREETVRKRLETYRNQTKVLINYYSDQHKLVNIDGNREIEAIFKDILAKLGAE
ncbi:MAG: adenylate kinase [Thermoplasmata archaeon]|nr:adenylate kinase [Thermoplasmata archaeon]